MVSRSGIGATTASAVLFSILLASNLLVSAASQGREAHYMQADAEDSLGDRAAALLGAGGADILLETQGFLSSRALGCSDAWAAVAKALGAQSDVQRSDGLAVSVTAGVASGGAVKDNLSMLAPFDGSVPGDLNMALEAVVSGSDGAAGVSLEWQGVHLVHIPVRLQRLAADCEDAVGRISAAVASAPAPNCTYAGASPLMESASRGPAATAEADGFAFSLGFSVVPGLSCEVGFQVVLRQLGVQGMGGPFSVQAEEGGSASFGPPPS